MAYGGQELTGILLCTAFANFGFPGEFVTSDTLWEKLMCYVGFFFFCCEGGKKNVNMELRMLEIAVFLAG